jgi:hypothetical protein
VLWLRADTGVTTDINGFVSQWNDLCRDEASARRLLRATLIYLPAWLAMLVVVAA